MANLRANRITSTEVFETTGSVQFDGSGDRLDIAEVSSQFTFGTGDFTIEFWTYFTKPSSDRVFTDWRSSGGAQGARPTLYYVQSVEQIRYYVAGDKISASFKNYNVWSHIALCRSSSSTKLFVDGVQVGITYSDNNDYLAAQNGSISIGDGIYTGYTILGHISNFRILKGTALYTTNFTPPTRELEVIPNTVLLACQSTTKADEEKTGKTITVNGNAVANELTPGLLTNVVKSGGSSAITGSVEFDGTGDYLLLNSGSSDFTLGTGDFTIECWAYPTRYGGIFQFFDSSVLDQTTSGPSIGIDVSENEWKIRYGTNSTGDSNIDVEYNQWYHLAYVRNSSTTTLYLNGINIFSVSDSTNYSANYPVVGGWYDTDYLMKGFISNFRVIKGTALYTSNFIPPTRKLTKLPGTVLLCCQDSNDPTTEATGKTITGHGDLSREDVGVELVTNGTFDTDLSGWTLSADTPPTWASGGYLQLNSDTTTFSDADQSITTKIGSTYEFSFKFIANPESTLFAVGTSQGGTQLVNEYIIPTVGTTYRYRFVATTTTTWIRIRDGAATANQQIDNVSVIKLDPGNRASDFTPSVGSDDSVEFAGPTTINTENYFYLPTGNTEQRGRGRGIFSGGYSTPNYTTTIEYIEIHTQGNAVDFGTFAGTNRGEGTSTSSTTRAVFGGGSPAPSTTVIDYVEISTTSNPFSFGDLSAGRRALCAVSNGSRGIFSGGIGDPTMSSVMDYVNIASTGTAINFGNLSQARRNLAPANSNVRGVFSGGNPGSSPNIDNKIDYITIASTGNAIDFGDASAAVREQGGCSSTTRGLFAGGYTAPARVNTIDYITIASTGNAIDFGDLLESRSYLAATSNKVRGVFAGGASSPVNSNRMDFVIITSTGNAQDFGDISENKLMYNGGCSDSHGGLG